MLIDSRAITDADVAAETTALGIAIPCESLWHKEFGHGPAAWIVWQVQCCPARGAVGLICDPCVQAILNYPGPARCQDCRNLTALARHTIKRLEPLR